uniref:Uncharacterized protein n=1 Tax=Romanomermis culicivorax TaxID=13658 RepID=A0A915JSK7_ROMCU
MTKLSANGSISKCVPAGAFDENNLKEPPSYKKLTNFSMIIDKKSENHNNTKYTFFQLVHFYKCYKKTT